MDYNLKFGEKIKGKAKKKKKRGEKEKRKGEKSLQIPQVNFFSFAQDSEAVEG